MCVYVEFLVPHFSDLSRCISKFTGWAMVEETVDTWKILHISDQFGTKTRVKYCYVDLSSWYGFWFAIICIDMNVIVEFSIAIQQF